MAQTQAVDDFLFDLLKQYDTHIKLSGARNPKGRYPTPSLTNDVLPMIYRWTKGPGQDFAQIYSRIEPALQLASRLLTEDYPLMWFCHLHFGGDMKTAWGATTGRKEHRDFYDHVRRSDWPPLPRNTASSTAQPCIILNRDELTRRDASGEKARPPVMAGDDFRQGAVAFGNARRNTHFYAALHILTM